MHSYIFAGELLKRGVELDLYVPSGKNSGDVPGLFDEKYRKNLRVFELNRPHFSRKLPGGYMRAEFEYSKHIYHSLKENSFGLNCIYAQGLTAWYMLKRGRKPAPILLNLHGYEFAQWLPGVKNRLKSKWLNYFFSGMIKKADYLVSLGGKIDEIIASYGIPKERIIAHHNGIHNTEIMMQGQKPAERNFIFVGRYERRKGIEELLNAWEYLAPQHAFLHFVGPIPELNQKELPGVFFHGAVQDKSQLNALYDNSHFLVLPSYSEGMPMVILEALQHECICLVSRVGAIEAYINEENGKLMDAGNSRQLVQCIDWALHAPDTELEEKRVAIRKLLPGLGWEKSTEDLLNSLDSKGIL